MPYVLTVPVRAHIIIAAYMIILQCAIVSYNAAYFVLLLL